MPSPLARILPATALAAGRRIAAALLLAAIPAIVLGATAAADPAAGPVVSGWRAAPLYGADVRSVAIHPADPALIVAGTSAGQVYLSRDGGATWGDAGDGVALPGWVVSDLVFDPGFSGGAGEPRPEPAPPPRLWAALWGIWGGGTVVSSDDLGRTWTPRGDGLPGDQVYALAVVSSAPSGDASPAGAPPARLYAGTRSGVYGSTDGGASWRLLTAALPEMQKVTSLMIDPGAPSTVIAGTWRRAYRSDDGGLTWRGVFDGMALDSEVFSLQPVPGRPGEIWASTCGWVYRTLDGGGRWALHQEGLAERRTPSFAVLPGGRLLAGTVDGLYTSDDAGATWQRRTDGGIAVLDIAVRDRRAVLATEGSGVWISDDGADTFRRSARGMTNVRVAALARAGHEILAAVNHAGPASGVYTSPDGGATFGPPEVRLPTVLALAVAGYRVFAGTEKGLYERSGVEWRPVTELGERRVEQIAAAGDRVVVRTTEGLYELAGGRFVAAPYHHGPPRSAAVFDHALWVSDGAGLYRLTAAANDTIPAPLTGGRLNLLGDLLALSGDGGVWTRNGADGSWRELTPGGAEVRPTGDPRYPALLVGESGAFLAEPAAGRLYPVALPVPAREVTAALLVDGRLVLGTSGYGLLIADVAAPSADTLAPSSSTSAAPAGSAATSAPSAPWATAAVPAAAAPGPTSSR